MTNPLETGPNLQLPGIDVADQVAELAVGQTVQPEVVASKPVAFGRFVKPEMYDVFGDYDLSDVTDAEIEWMKPENLGACLFGQKRDAKFVVGGISLNATEHGIVARSPAKLIEKAEERALKDKDLDDDVLATAARAQIHALEEKLVAMGAHSEKLLEQRMLINELAREAKKPGYAHKPEERMKMLIAAAWMEFTNILDVAHLQRGWDDEKRARAEAALIHYLTQGSQRARIGHWQSMIELASGYLGARMHIFGARSREANVLLNQKSADYAEKFE